MLKGKKLRVLLTSALATLFMSQAASAATYKVVQGDSLYTIGRTFNTSTVAIMSANNLSSSTIYPGQILNIPDQVYTVKSGDTLYSISIRYGVSVDALRKANGEWDDYLYVGQRLSIPGGQASTASVQTYTAPKAVISYTASELDLLARLIRAEAENQPYAAKVAVGAVVVNRVQSSSFPNTINEVINQRINGYWQFSPVMNGYINRPATQEDINAALEALRGSDATNGALFYFDDSSTNTWLWSKPIALRVGRMVYVY